MYGELDGALPVPVLSTPFTEFAPVVNASLSPEALKKDCPAACMFLKMLSVVVDGPPPQPQLQDNCLIELLNVTIEFKILFCKPVLPASKLTILASPGAIAMAISMSSETSPLPPADSGIPLKPATNTA